MNNYKTMKNRHQQDVNAFPMFFAFNNDQFDEGMKRLGLNPTDTDKIYRLGSIGGFYKRDDSGKLHEMFDRHEREMQEAIKNDTTGDGFIFDMFNYELGNHEYIYTGDISDTLDALGLTVDEVNASKTLQHGLKRAIKAQQNNNY